MQLLANENTTLRESLLSFSSSLSQAMKLGRSAFFGTAFRVSWMEFHPCTCSAIDVAPHIISSDFVHIHMIIYLFYYVLLYVKP